MTITNAWGEPVEEHPEKDPWHVPEDKRLDEDFPDTDPTSNALDDVTGDDLDGWQPGDPVGESAGEPE